MRHKGLFLTFAALGTSALLLPTMSAQSYFRRANLISAADPYQGRCTISVVVDGTSDVEIRGDNATLRDIAGEPARWQRFECTGPLTNAATGLRIRAIEGTGRMTLTHDAYDNGVAVVRVDNAGRGDELYTFDILWQNRPVSPPAYTAPPATYGYSERSVITEDDSIQACRSAVEGRIRGDGYRYVRFGSITADDRGRHEMVTGTATGDRPSHSDYFTFSCRVNPEDGAIRHVDVTRR